MRSKETPAGLSKPYGGIAQDAFLERCLSSTDSDPSVKALTAMVATIVEIRRSITQRPCYTETTLVTLRVVSASKAMRGGGAKLIEDQCFIFRIWFLQPWSADRYFVRSHVSISLSK